MSEQGIKLPAKALNTSNVIVLDANGDWLLEMSISQQGARTKVIQALNGYGKAVKFIKRVDRETQSCIESDSLIDSEVLQRLGDDAEQLLKHLGALND